MQGVHKLSKKAVTLIEQAIAEKTLWETVFKCILEKD